MRPFSKENLTTEQLVEDVAQGHADMERIMRHEPQLNAFGFGGMVYAASPEERIARFHKEREQMIEAQSLVDFLSARNWLQQFSKTKALNKRGTSYGLKHAAERDIGYVTNGVFIAAAIAEGFTVQRAQNAPNAWLNISSKAWGAW